MNSFHQKKPKYIDSDHNRSNRYLDNNNIDYSTVPEEEFSNVFKYISDTILHYPYWSKDSNFFRNYCENCGIIRYLELNMDFHLVKKDCYELLFCSKCWEEIERQSAKRGVKFETEKYVYEEIIKEIESPDLEK